MQSLYALNAMQSYVQKPAASQSHKDIQCVFYTKRSHTQNQIKIRPNNEPGINGGCAFAILTKKWNRIAVQPKSSGCENQPSYRCHHSTKRVSRFESPIFTRCSLKIRSHNKRKMNSPYVAFDSAINVHLLCSRATALFRCYFGEWPMGGERNTQKKTKENVVKNTGLSLNAIKIKITMSRMQRIYQNL